MKYAFWLITLLFFTAPDSFAAPMEVESRLTATGRGDRAFLERLENALAQTEKRIRAIFGMDAAGRAVVVRSQENFDLTLSDADASSGRGKTHILLINSEVVQNYSAADLQIACARGLYLMVWPKFRKPYSTDNVLVERLYVEGMTAYAAELLYPKAQFWTCAGLYGNEGKGLYKQYLPLEKSLAEEVQRTLAAGAARHADDRLVSRQRTGSTACLIPAGAFLSFRIIKTFEKDMDPKMIQLMDFNEFRERLPAGLEKLRQGFKQAKYTSPIRGRKTQ